MLLASMAGCVLVLQGTCVAANMPEAQPATQPEAVAAPFRDVPATHWAFEAVEKLRRAGIMVGYPDGTFGGQAAPLSPRPGAGVEEAQSLGTDSVPATVWAKWPSVPAFGGFLNSGARGGRHVWRPYW